MIPINPLQQLYDLNRTSPQFHEQLSNFFRGSAYRHALSNIPSENLAWLVDHLDGLLAGISDHTIPIFQESLQELAKICGDKQVLPKSCAISEFLLGCVYEGTFSGSKVRIRRVRMHSGRDVQKAKEVAVASRHLIHPNIVPILGTTTDPLELISEWMPGGDLTAYITNNPETDRLSLLSDVAEGINYLHSCNVIHGDLKGSNILVDATGHARIADFGLAMVDQDPGSTRNAPAEHGQSVRWIAPEILNNLGTYSKEADIFSFAGVTIEAFTGAAPFGDKPLHEVIVSIVSGERPPRPNHPSLTDGLWASTQRCWDQEVHLRPTASQVLRSLVIPAWKRLIDRPLSTENRVSLVQVVFSDHNETEAVKGLYEKDAQAFVDVMDETLDDLAPLLRKKCLATLCKICGCRGLLPRSVQIATCYDPTSNPLARGGYAEVWKGKFQEGEVAVKVLKVYQTSDLNKIRRRFCKEVMTWKSLRHENVLPLVGVTMSENRFEMVSEWMPNGSINEFVKVHKGVNRFELLEGAIRGLIFMHGEGMIHGDLKGANILIDRNGRACLADFGLITFISDPENSITSNSFTIAGTTRWMSPELLDPEHFGFEDSRPTKDSDCYALGMVIYEVLSGQAPFAREKDLVVMLKVFRGERPERPAGSWFPDDLWNILGRCWSPLPKDRPAIEGILDYFGRISASQPLYTIDETVQIGVEDPSPLILQSNDQSPIPTQSCSLTTLDFGMYVQDTLTQPTDPFSFSVSLSYSGVDNSPIGILEEMEYQPILEMAHVDRPGLASWGLSGRDVVITGSGTFPALAHDGYDSIYLSGSGPTGAEDREITAGSWFTGVFPTVVDGAAAPPFSVPLLPMPINWFEIPQQKYTTQVGNRSFLQPQAVTFSVDGVPGFNMQRALGRAFAGLEGSDSPVLENATGPVLCRLLFPGYPMHTKSSPIAVKNWKKARAPITKSKLAYEIAKRVYQYLDALAAIPIDPSAGLQWTIGEGCMKFENMYLTNVSWVSKGSLQPEIWVDTGGSWFDFSEIKS